MAPPAPPVAPVAMALAVAGALLVAAHWAMPTQVGLDIGMYLPNTTWHNAPFAARFVQDAQVGALHFTEVLRLTVWFYPQNSELLHSAGVLFLGNDFLSPLINIGWMALCLLAAWSFGRPYGAGAAAVLASRWSSTPRCCCSTSPATPRTTPPGSSSCSPRRRSWSTPRRSAGGDQAARPIAGGEPGRAAEPPRPASGGRRCAGLPAGALIVAGLAAGLALGTKLNLLAPFGLLTLGVIAVTGRAIASARRGLGRRARWSPAASGSPATWSRRATRCPGSTPGRCPAPTSSTSTSASPTRSRTTSPMAM